MDLNTIVYYLSDEVIWGFVTATMDTHSLMWGLFGGGVWWLVNKWVAWTPWKSDDALLDKVKGKIDVK